VRTLVSFFGLVGGFLFASRAEMFPDRDPCVFAEFFDPVIDIFFWNFAVDNGGTLNAMTRPSVLGIQSEMPRNEGVFDLF